MASRLCIIPARALEDEAMTPTELRVLCAIGRFTSEDGTGVWAAAQTLADVAKVDVRHLRRAVNALVERGYVKRDSRYRNNGSQDTNLLSILLDPPTGNICPPPLAESATPPLANIAIPPLAESASQTTYLNDPSERPHYTGMSKRESLTDADPFLTFWQIYPKRAGGNPKLAALKAWEARIRSGVLPEQMLAGAERYATFIRMTGKEGSEYVKQASSFLGPNEHWNEPWEIPASKGELRATATTTLLQDWVNNGE